SELSGWRVSDRYYFPFIPAPLGIFIKDNISVYIHLLRSHIEYPISLSDTTVSNKNPNICFPVKLISFHFWNVCITYTAKYPEMLHSWFHIMPGFKRSFIFHCLRWKSIQQINSHIDSLSPEFLWKVLFEQKTSAYLHNCTILS